MTISLIISGLLSILVGAFIFCVFMLAKNSATFDNQKVIIDAICDYALDQIEKSLPVEVDYSQMEDYDKTMHRLWDWGYENILPKDAFEKVRPYIKEGGYHENRRYYC